MNLPKIFLIVSCLTLLQGCKEQVLYSDLNEQEANEMVALLYSTGLPASKIGEKGGVYRVDTSTDAFAGAMAVLQSHGLPRKRFSNLGEVFAKEGFVSSPLEERARLNHAVAEELSHTLTTIDGVLVARVHLAVPEKEHLADKTQTSSASVFIKHRYDVDLSGSVSKIKALVVDGVENLPYENVTVGLFAASLPASAKAPVENNVLQAGVHLDRSVIAIGAIALIGLGLISMLFGRFAWRRKSRG